MTTVVRLRGGAGTLSRRTSRRQWRRRRRQ